MRSARRVLIFLMLGISGVIYVWLVRRRLLRWGSTAKESAQTWPGDDLIQNATLQGTYAIDIHAAPSAVWPWLAQMGRHKTGFYALDTWLNEGVPSAAVVRQDIPALEPGAVLDNQWRALDMRREAYLVLGNFLLPGRFFNRYAITYSYHLVKTSEHTTRLVLRVRYKGRRWDAAWLEPALSTQSIIQLTNLRLRAEANQAYLSDKARANGNIRTPVRN